MIFLSELIEENFTKTTTIILHINTTITKKFNENSELKLKKSFITVTKNCESRQISTTKITLHDAGVR